MSSSAASAREQGDSKTIDQNVLSRIQHLDVTQHITDKSQKAVAYGGYCEVFKGCVRRVETGETDVAIKRLRFHTDEEKVLKVRPSSLIVEELVELTLFVQQFAKEVYVWSKLSHPNILPLLGFSICEETGFPLLISEWMYLGTAWTYVQNNQEQGLSLVADLVCSLYYAVALHSG